MQNEAPASIGHDLPGERASASSSRARTGLLVVVGAATMLPWVPAPLALALGAVLGLGVGHGHHAALERLTPVLLGASVVGLGAGIDLRDVAQVGLHGALLTLVTVASCIGLGAVLARFLRVDRSIAVLVAFGTAICGGTAIAAMAPVVGARREETSVALGTVFVLNAIAMLVLPLVGRGLGLDADAFGTLAALAVHDTSAVVGAAASFGPEAVDVATTIKLARALLLVPASLAVTALSRVSGAPTRGGERVAPKMPWFILGFAAVAALVTWLPTLAPVGDVVAGAARRTMVLALFCVGASTSRAALARTGPRPLLLGLVLWLVVAALSVGLVLRA